MARIETLHIPELCFDKKEKGNFNQKTRND